jgi:hypothetical protein
MKTRTWILPVSALGYRWGVRKNGRSRVAGIQKNVKTSLPIARKAGLPTCSVFRQTASVRQEIDCEMQSNLSSTPLSMPP